MTSVGAEQGVPEIKRLVVASSMMSVWPRQEEGQCLSPGAANRIDRTLAGDAEVAPTTLGV